VPVWGWFAIAAGAAAGILLAAWMLRRLWVSRARRQAVVLYGRAQGVAAAIRSLEGIMQRLEKADDASYAAFVRDPQSDDRRALAELAHRMGIVADDLEHTALPKMLWDVADRLEGVARQVADEAGRVGDADTSEAVLDAVDKIRLADIEGRFEHAASELDAQMRTLGVKEASVYGGGLYI
jgi:hypothetical protein